MSPEGVLDLLNAHLTTELTAVNQYFLAAKMCASWGFSRLHDKFRDLSMVEMKDVEELLEHILYLEGLPNMQRLNQVRVGENVPELLQAGLDLERGAVDFMRGAIEHCHQVGDYKTRGMFEATIGDEENHVDWFETQLDAIRLVGLENYLSQQIRWLQDAAGGDWLTCHLAGQPGRWCSPRRRAPPLPARANQGQSLRPTGCSQRTLQLVA